MMIEKNNVLKRIEGGTFYSWTIWRKLRKEVIYRDNNECKVCGVPGQKARLYVHHKKELKEFPNLALDINNLITLCGDCHNKIHEKDQQLRRHNKKNKFINEERW